MTPRDRQSSISSTVSQYSTGNSVFSDMSAESAATLVTMPDLPEGQQVPETRLPCEFVGYGSCDRTFALNDVDNWIGHIVSQHLENKPPDKVLCWFCDGPTFDSAHDRVDRYENYRRRMWHIHGHYVQRRYTIHDIRPDHYFNTHAREANLVPIPGYEAVRDWSEVPQGSWIIPHDALPPGMQARNSRAEWESSNPHDAEREYRRRHGGSRRDGVPQRHHSVVIQRGHTGRP